MTIQQTIKEEIKTAMRAKDTTTLSVLRGLSAAFTNELVSLKRMPSDNLTDEEALNVINRAAKQRKDSIEQFEKGGRNDLVESEKEELVIIEKFLPQLMLEDEIRVHVVKKRDELGLKTPEQFGQLMKSVMADLKGKADGGIVKKIIEESLTN